jgi:4-hydroxybenzoyl-CoA reductase subunit beta
VRLPAFSYLEPYSIGEAASFLREHGRECKIMAGGTDLLPSMKQRLLKPKVLMSLQRISDLEGIGFDETQGLYIGSMVTLHALETSPLVKERYPIIKQAVHAVGSPQLRRMGTVGGNLSLNTRCHYYNQSESWRKSRPRCLKMGGDTCNAVGGGKKCFAVFSGDLAPALIALGAEVKLVSHSSERILPLRDYYTGNGAEPLAGNPDEILAGVKVPPLSPDAFAAYFKFRIRESIDFPFASMAAVISLEEKGEFCRKASVVIGAVGTRPQEVKEIAEITEGKRLDGQVIEEASDLARKAAKPVDNLGSSPEYRRLTIKAFVRTAFQIALEGSTQRSA